MNRQGFHVTVSPVTSGKNHSVIAKSAYNSGSKLEDKKTGKVHDYTSKNKEKIMVFDGDNGEKYNKKIEKNVAFSTLVLPQKMPDISIDRQQFWNDIEMIETRKNAQYGTEIDVMFPDGLDENQRIELAKKYSQELADRYNVLVDVSIHRPHVHEQKTKNENGETVVLELSSRNHHAHILLSSREILPSNDNSYSLSNRKNWSLWATSERLKKGLNGRGDELKHVRKLWADLANEMLPQNKNITEKSYREQGLNVLPKMKLGKSLYKDILKGKRSIINEYNETIDDLNNYIKNNKLSINYNDDGRIDDIENEQEFKGVKVVYKKRKPFAKFDLNKITISDPSKELEKQADNKASYDDVLSSFMKMAESVEQKKKTERSGLFSSMNAMYEQLKKQASEGIVAKDNLEKFPKIADKMGLDWQEEIKKISDELRNFNTLQATFEVERNLSIIEQFRQDETLQTTDRVQDLKKRISQLEKTVEKNRDILRELKPLNNKMLDEYRQLQQLEKPFNKQLDKLDKKIDDLNRLVIEKESWGHEWGIVFDSLREIDVTNNYNTFYKFEKLADYDVTELKRLENEHKELKQLKASQINDNRLKQLDDLTQSVSDYSELNNSELTALKKQVLTSSKTYERLEPLFTSRQKMLDEQGAVIATDEDFYKEVTTTKTTKLNQNLLEDWQERANQLHAKLLKEHEQAELKRQAEEQRRQEQEKQRQIQQIEQEKQRQIQEYEQRVKTFTGKVFDEVAKRNFRQINAPEPLILKAEQVAISTLILDGMMRVSDITELQAEINEQKIDKLKPLLENNTQDFLKELDNLPNNKAKIEVIGQLNEQFKKLPDVATSTSTSTTLTETLEQRQQDIKHDIERANSYTPSMW